MNFFLQKSPRPVDTFNIFHSIGIELRLTSGLTLHETTVKFESGQENYKKMPIKKIDLLVWMLVHILLAVVESNDRSLNMTEVLAAKAKLAEELLRHNYKSELPPTEDGGPTTVKFNVIIKSIYDVSELTSSFKIRYYLSLHWRDPRLRFTPFNNDTSDFLPLPLHEAVDKSKLFSILFTSTIKKWFFKVFTLFAYH